MTRLEFTDTDKAALAALLRQTIAANPFPMCTARAPATGDPGEAGAVATAALPQPYPPPKPAGTPSLLLARKKGRRR